MAATKSAAAAGKNYVTTAAMKGQAYADGVAAPRRPWAAAAAAAEANYDAGTQAAIARKSFGKGIRKAGDPKWQERSRTKGVQNYPTGTASAEQAYVQGIAPYIDVIASTTLPPRFARRDPRNLQRVAAIATALGQKKESMLK
ncbi:MAG TPA: hypothetical protein VJ578_04750 [Dehalococcoidia bacterium]|nr:hypothetical protein [Dehalococcoidia bacterium]